MKKTLLLLSAAAAFTMASCSDQKNADVTDATTAPEAASANAQPAAADVDMAYRNRATRIADQMATDMKITDTAVVSRIRTTYYNRARRVGELQTKYASDTAGMAAEMRTVYADTDTEFKGYLPAESYTAYESSRANYSDDRFMNDDMSSSASSAGSSSDMSTMEAGSKMKNDDGSKVKVKADGDVKIKDAEGNKMKLDGDDGTVKLKPEDGEKAKIK